MSAGTTEHLAVVPAHYRIQTPLGPDRSVPIRLSQALRDARPDLIELETFDADHTLCWWERISFKVGSAGVAGANARGSQREGQQARRWREGEHSWVDKPKEPFS